MLDFSDKVKFKFLAREVLMLNLSNREADIFKLSDREALKFELSAVETS